MESNDLQKDSIQLSQEETSFSQSITPRRVPVCSAILLLFGHFFSQFGWGLFGFGLILFWLSGIDADFSQLQFHKGYSTTQGIISNIENTNKNSNGQSVLKYSFIFTDSSGVKVSSESYRPGGVPMKKGQKIVVEYLPDNSSIARINGMLRKTYSWGIVLFPSIFPLMGLILIVCTLFKGFKRIGLLRNGILVPAELKSISKIGHTPSSYDLVFEYTSVYGTKHTFRERTENTAELRDQKLEPLIYNPSKPNIAMLLDSLPGYPRIDNKGVIILTEPNVIAYSILSLLLPILVILGHGYYVYITYIK